MDCKCKPETVYYNNMTLSCSFCGNHSRNINQAMELRCKMISDGSSTISDYHGHCIRRALDNKLRKLRKILTADEDIRVELDRILCQLMKLALRNSLGRTNPPPTRWMQCKLLDLLTLTEKAIQRRKTRFIQTYPLKAIQFGEENKSDEIIALEKIRNDETGKIIMDAYRHLLSGEHSNEEASAKYYLDTELEDEFSIPPTGEFLDSYEHVDKDLPHIIDPGANFNGKVYVPLLTTSDDAKLERTQAWVEEDIKVISNPSYDNFDIISGDANNKLSKIDNFKYKKRKHKKRSTVLDNMEGAKVTLLEKCKHKHKNAKIKNKGMAKNFVKILPRKKSRYNNLFKDSSSKLCTKKYRFYELREKRNREHNHTSLSKPIPKSLIDLCHPELGLSKSNEVIVYARTYNEIQVDKQDSFYNVAATEESFLIDIITEDKHETIALRRTIGTDADYELETLVKSISSHIKLGQLYRKNEENTENISSKTIFLNDINEPSTSTGIRHTSINTQCGPDGSQNYSVLSAATSFRNISETISRYNIGVLCKKSFEFVTCNNNECNCDRKLTPRIKSVGIRIRDSDTNVSHNDKVLRVQDLITDIWTSTEDINTKSLEISVNDSDKNVFSNKYSFSAHHSLTKLRSFTKGSLELCNRHFYLLSVSSSSIDNKAPLKENYGTSTIAQKESSNRVHHKISTRGFNKINYSTMTDFENRIEIHKLTNDSNPNETKLLKPAASGFKITKSTLDFNESFRSRKYFTKAPLFRNPSDLHVNFSVSREALILHTNEYKRPNLSYGAVQVHSFNDKKHCEDVIYQGEWQGYNRPKLSAKKKPQRPMVTKRTTESKFSRKETISNEEKSSITINKQNSKQNRNSNSTKAKLSDVFKIKKQNARSKVSTPVRKVTKVSSKTTISVISSKTKITTLSLKKNSMNSQYVSHKTYVPPYLKRNLEKIHHTKIKDMTQKLDFNTLNKERPFIRKQLLERTKYPKSSKNMMKFNCISPDYTRYLVLRNDIESNINASSSGQSEVESQNRGKITNNGNRKPYSSSSQNSSCSSPNSIATVRLASNRSKGLKLSNSSYKSSIGETSRLENINPNKPKQIPKKSKNAQSPMDKGFDNKENLPQTSETWNKEVESRSKGGFVGLHNNVFVAQVTKDPSTMNSVSKKTLSNKSNLKLSVIENNITSMKPISPLITPIKSSKSHIFREKEVKLNILDVNSNKSNMLLKSQIQNKLILSADRTQTEATIDDNLLNERLSNFDKILVRDPRIVSTIREIIEEILCFVDTLFDNGHSFDSETVILSREDLNQFSEDDLSTSYKTAVVSDYKINTSIKSDNENSLNRTFDTTLGDESIVSLTETRVAVDDLDISFQSLTTVTNFSNHFLADNNLNNSSPFSRISVQDIFERKNKILSQNAPGALALQLFSGYSLNTDPVTGDRADPINLIDSETGSIAVEIPRLATSEELFVSGRSSGSYQSCLLEEDAVVPNWLFRLISYQQSAEEDETASEHEVQEESVIPMPTNNLMIDANGNEIDPVLGVGAGDGRGMHSNHSQDSSGRGTSLSSTDSSSGQQSEAILIDPFTGQFEVLRDSVDSAIVIPNFPDGSDQENYVFGTHEGADASNSSGNCQSNFVLPNPVLTTSDFDADVSSLDTDVPDSSDN